jgi:hypothetical protein
MARVYVDPATGEVFGGLDENGREIPDPRPLRLPAGFKKPETLAEQVQRLVRTHISREAAESGHETFEESEDFDVDDDPDISTPYETFFDPVLGKEISPSEFRQHEQRYRQQYLEAQREYFRSLDQAEVLERGPARNPDKQSASGSPDAPAPKEQTPRG